LKFQQILNIEHKREKRFNEYKSSILEKFKRTPTLTIPKDTSFRFAFNPSTMLTFENGNFYFPYFRASGSWGNIKIDSGGGIFYNDFVKIPIEIKNMKTSNARIYTDNWNLELNKGWKIKENGKNQYILIKQ
jgi:hypothetical protein